MMKIYKVGNYMRQIEEGHQPEGAVEVKTNAEPEKKPPVEVKEKKPANKARAVKTK